jgi:transposase-like protein
LYFTGLGVKAIERVTNIHHTTVSYWIQKIDVEKVDLYALSPESLPGSKR